MVPSHTVHLPRGALLIPCTLCVAQATSTIPSLAALAAQATSTIPTPPRASRQRCTRSGASRRSTRQTFSSATLARSRRPSRSASRTTRPCTHSCAPRAHTPPIDTPRPHPACTPRLYAPCGPTHPRVRIPFVRSRLPSGTYLLTCVYRDAPPQAPIGRFRWSRGAGADDALTEAGDAGLRGGGGDVGGRATPGANPHRAPSLGALMTLCAPFVAQVGGGCGEATEEAVGTDGSAAEGAPLWVSMECVACASSEAPSHALEPAALRIGCTSIDLRWPVPTPPAWGVGPRAAHRALPHRAPSPRCAAESAHHVWLQVGLPPPLSYKLRIRPVAPVSSDHRDIVIAAAPVRPAAGGRERDGPSSRDDADGGAGGASVARLSGPGPHMVHCHTVHLPRGALLIPCMHHMCGTR